MKMLLLDIDNIQRKQITRVHWCSVVDGNKKNFNRDWVLLVDCDETNSYLKTSDLLWGCPEKVQKISQMVVQNGDESHGTIINP